MTCTGDFTEKENARARLGGQSRAVKRSGAEGIKRGKRTETSKIDLSLSKPSSIGQATATVLSDSPALVEVPGLSKGA
jgi:hypothetical protein